MDGPLVSDFPQYCDGDVVVLIGLRQKYQLHASVLRRNSPYFTHLLSPNHAVTLNQRARKEGRIVHYQLELTGCFVAGNVPRDPFSLVVSSSPHASFVHVLLIVPAYMPMPLFHPISNTPKLSCTNLTSAGLASGLLWHATQL